MRGLELFEPDKGAISGGEQKGSMSVREAGRKGGERVKEIYGKEFYSKIGQLGGEAVKRIHGSEFYTKIGKMGGEKARERLEQTSK